MVRELSPAAALARMIAGARSVVALTGAGISVPSGIPDFRTPVTGVWENVDPMEVAHINVFRRDPQRFWAFYGQRFALLDGKRPNDAHRALARLQEQGRLDALVTQNIDGLHTAAGSRDVIEVHGTIAHATCPFDGERVDLHEARTRMAAAADGVPRCGSGHALKPDVVLFGELLPEGAINKAFALAGQADLLLCVGSSLEVHPVARLPEITLAGGGQVAIVTAGRTPFDDVATLKLDGDVVDEMSAVLAALDAQ